MAAYVLDDAAASALRLRLAAAAVFFFPLQVALHVSRMGDHGTPWGLTLSHALSFLSNLCVCLQIRESDCHDPSTCVWSCG
jgi:hypothetical protein